MTELAASILIFLGAVFVFSAAVGLLRMPEAMSRIQAATKATTLGALLMLGGFELLHPESMAKYLLIVAFVFIGNPVSSHALARAGLKGARGSKPSGKAPNPAGEGTP